MRTWIHKICVNYINIFTSKISSSSSSSHPKHICLIIIPILYLCQDRIELFMLMYAIEIIASTLLCLFMNLSYIGVVNRPNC